MIVVVVVPVIVAALVIGNANVGVADPSEQDRTSLTLHRAPE
ncbi:MAG TPA: hypothetical protein VM513_07520 [Kofleriaceae bacterium]|nr:hypothetical protein [Kofleriaceae bacterium]